ncbi:MAG TPA: CBS domain-containing protein [Usitatibacter sp.]|nr:CBS domain-containing protein [Usitatibacter sp.]
MKVERVCTRNVATVARSDSIRKAAELMRALHVGALIVTERADGGADVAGIVTDRDLVLRVLAEGRDAESLAVEKVMMPVVASVNEGADLLEVSERMRSAGVRRLLVTDADGNPAGVVSIEDMVDGLATELANISALLRSEVRRESGETQAAQP